MDFDAFASKKPVDETTANEKAEALAQLTGISVTQEEKPAQIQTEEVKTEPVKEEVKEEPKQEVKTETKEKTVEEVEQEKKELKQRLLSRVSIEAEANKKAQSELNDLRKQLAEKKEAYDRDEISADDYLEARDEITFKKLEVNQTTKKLQELDEYEKTNFYKENPQTKAYQDQLEDIKKENPNLSYFAANTLYLALNNPQALIKETTNANFTWWASADVYNPAPTIADLKAQAVKEFNQMMWRG